MSDFFKKFLTEDARKTSSGGRFVALAAFGKHPGWDDHVEDLGLETESLNLAKTVFYVNGIGGQIDSGAWEKLDPAQQLPAFKHLFVWQRTGQILVGRLWSSSDGKGRKRYPMVVCAHFGGVTLGWALKQALPVLADLEEGCVKTNSAAEVRSLLSRKRVALREAIQSADGRGEYAPVTPDALHRIVPVAGDAKAEGFLRVLYQIQSQMGAFVPGSINLRTNLAALRAQQLRVPASGENPQQTLLFWTRFFLTQVDSDAPLLLTLPLEADWVDATVGEPESHEFFCLRASPKAVPLVSEVPYKIDDAFRAKAVAFLDGFRRGETAPASLQPAVTAATTGDAGGQSRGGWWKWFGMGVIVVAVGAAVFMMRSRVGSPETGAKAPEEKTKAATADTKTNRQIATPVPETNDAAKAEAERAKARMAAEAEAARLAEEKKTADAMAAAARLKAEAEAAAKERERQLAEAAAKEIERQKAEAAARERERQLAEAARIEREREEARQKVLAEEQRKQAEELAARKKAEEQARERELAAATTNTATSRPTESITPTSAPAQAEMTNSIGMVFVSLPSRIWVGKYEVTQAEYTKVMGSNPSKSVNDRQPVEQVTWNEAIEFIRRLNEMERGKLPAGKVYALPTEKQWLEFRGDQRVEDLPAVAPGKTGPSVVGESAPPNKFGLYDVLGNVCEWCLDDATSGEKVIRGGAFNTRYENRTLLPDRKLANCGFRCIVAAP